MKRYFVNILFFILIFVNQFSYCDKYKVVYMEIPYGESTLLSTFYCFNDFTEGEKIANNEFKINNLKEKVGNARLKKLIPIEPGSELLRYNYAIICSFGEFWLFKNNDDGYLWGTGFYIKK
ncbi:MAG: hypothetical protein IJ312_02830 [Treponema sp.]|nr:hypothetical protein [Treponema sp.]